MAEMLICVEDKLPSTDPRAEALYKVGDVIVIVQDGHPWTATERTNPEWRIVKLPGVDPATLNAFVDHETIPDTGIGTGWKRRLINLDLVSPEWSQQELNFFDRKLPRTKDAIEATEARLNNTIKPR